MPEIDPLSLQKEIDLLDRQLGQEIENQHGRTKRIQTNRGFPLGSWIFAIVLVAAWMFGDSVPGLPYDQFRFIFFLVAAVGVLLAIFFTLSFIWSNLAGGNKVKQIEDSDKAVELRTKRDALKVKLAEIKKEKGIG